MNLQDKFVEDRLAMVKQYAPDVSIWGHKNHCEDVDLYGTKVKTLHIPVYSSSKITYFIF